MVEAAAAAAVDGLVAGAAVAAQAMAQVHFRREFWQQLLAIHMVRMVQVDIVQADMEVKVTVADPALIQRSLALRLVQLVVVSDHTIVTMQLAYKNGKLHRNSAKCRTVQYCKILQKYFGLILWILL